MFGTHKALVKALQEACRWKIALDAANKGARRKSRQARGLREKVKELEKELSRREEQVGELNADILRRYNQGDAVITRLRKELADSTTRTQKNECEIVNLRAANSSLHHELERARETGVL